MGVFDKRVSFKPFEYPEVVKFKEGIQHSYWLISEWNFLSDIQDFKVKLSPLEQNAIKNALLAISQIEVSVKRFWTKLGDRFPKPEIEQVGVCFGESEIRHSDSYSHLLQVLDLNNEFEHLLDNPVINGRVEYLTKYLKGSADNSNQNYTLVLTLFSMFIENVSLFSQFLVIKSFNKYRGVLKDTDNVIQATAKEECYIEGTEVLTPSGWVDLRNISVGDDVVQYVNGRLQPVKVLHKTESDFEGDLIKFHSEKSQCVVTPGHDMVYYDVNDKFKKVKAADFKPHSRKYIPRGGVYMNVGDSELSFEERLRVAIQADGSVLKWTNAKGETLKRGKSGGYTYSIPLKKQRKIDRLTWILEEGGYEYVCDVDRGMHIFKVKYFSLVNCKEFDWVDLKDKTADWCFDFVSEISKWDGYRPGPKNTYGYSSTNKKAIDKAQAVAVLAGCITSVGKRVDKRKISYKPCYKLLMRKAELKPASHAYKKSKVNYKGKVYCVTVPSGVIVTRYHDQVMVAGNCIHALFGVWLINTIREENPEWFNEDFYGKLYRACKKAFEAEFKIVNWIFEKGDLPFLSAFTTTEFIKQRFNDSLMLIGANPLFNVDSQVLDKVRWFNEEIDADTHIDFFHKRSVAYTKNTKPITAGDLF